MAGGIGRHKRWRKGVGGTLICTASSTSSVLTDGWGKSTLLNTERTYCSFIYNLNIHNIYIVRILTMSQTHARTSVNLMPSFVT